MAGKHLNSKWPPTFQFKMTGSFLFIAILQVSWVKIFMFYVFCYILYISTVSLPFLWGAQTSRPLTCLTFGILYSGNIGWVSDQFHNAHDSTLIWLYMYCRRLHTWWKITGTFSFNFLFGSSSLPRYLALSIVLASCGVELHGLWLFPDWN